MWNACHILKSIEVTNFLQWAHGRVRVCVCLLYTKVSYWNAWKWHWFWYNHVPILRFVVDIVAVLVTFGGDNGNNGGSMLCLCSSFNTNVVCNTWYQVAIKYYWWDVRIQTAIDFANKHRKHSGIFRWYVGFYACSTKPTRRILFVNWIANAAARIYKKWRLWVYYRVLLCLNRAYPSFREHCGIRGEGKAVFLRERKQLFYSEMCVCVSQYWNMLTFCDQDESTSVRIFNILFQHQITHSNWYPIHW